MFEVNVSLTFFFFFFAMEIYPSLYLYLSDWPLHLDCTSTLTLTQSQTYFLEKKQARTGVVWADVGRPWRSAANCCRTHLFRSEMKWKLIRKSAVVGHGCGNKQKQLIMFSRLIEVITTSCLRTHINSLFASCWNTFQLMNL